MKPEVWAAVWAAVGQVGAFVVAIAAFIFALVSRKDSKKAIRQSERSATAAEVSARAAEAAVEEARRGNELTMAEIEERAIAKAAEDFGQARLVRGTITWRTSTGIGTPGRSMTNELRARAENASKYPALDVRYQHVDHAPGWRPLASILRPGGSAEVAFDVAEPFETAEDHSELVAGTMIAYDLGGNEWLRRGTSEPTPLPEV